MATTPYTPAKTTDAPVATPKTVVDEGHPNAADKPWYERPGHAGAAVTPPEGATTGRKVVKDE